MNAAGAIVAPLAMLANEVLPHPILAHTIAAPRRVLWSSSLGRISYYEDDGGGGGLPIVMLHDVGAAASAKELAPLFDQLRGERPLIVPDVLGHGFSERKKTPFTRDDYVRFVTEVVTDVSRRYGATVDILATGTTCELAAAAIVRSSRHVRSLTMIRPTGFEPDAWLVRRLLKLLPFGAASVRDPNVVADVYDALRVPTCFVHGSDGDVPRASIEFLTSAHPSMHTSEIRGTKDLPHVERADATADALRAFWRTLAVKPELRLIRGEKSERVTPIRRGSASAARRRSWT